MHICIFVVNYWVVSVEYDKRMIREVRKRVEGT
jgi:hypothetical protein